MFTRTPEDSQRVFWPYPWSQVATDGVSPIRRARYDSLTAAGLENFDYFQHLFSAFRSGKTECARGEVLPQTPHLDPITL